MASIDEILEYQNLENRIETLKKSFKKQAQELLERKYKPNLEYEFYGACVDDIYFNFKKRLVIIDYSLQWAYKIENKTRIMKFKEFCAE